MSKEIDFKLLREIELFLQREAQFLDDGNWAAWLDLFAEDGIYWLPTTRDQVDWATVPSIVHEDRSMLIFRVTRLQHPHAYANQPMPRTVHLIGSVDVTDWSDTVCNVTSNLIVLEYQDERRRLFGGRVRHRLQRKGESFEIREKRIDLIDAAAPHEAIAVIL